MKRLALLLVLALVPLASAQVPTADFAIDLQPIAFLNPESSTELAFDLTVGCMEVLENAGEADVSVTLKDAPEWLTAEAVTLHFGLEDCIGEESLTKSGILPVTTSNAPGLEAFTLAIEAALGSHTVTSEMPDVMVDYLPGSSMDPAGDKTFQVHNGTYEFTMTINITANAKTMVMFENKVVSGAASLTGLKANIFDVANGDRVLNSTIRFTAPEGPWTQETVTFYTYSHCLDKEGCTENFAQNITWTFQNASPEQGITGAAAGKESPGATPVLIGLGMLGLVAVLRRS